MYQKLWIVKRLPSLRNLECRTLKIEKEKINQILPRIATNNVTELNELTYSGAKLIFEKIGSSSKSTKKNSKPRWEIRQETQIKNTKTGQNDKTKERHWNIREQKGKGNKRKIIQLEEINQKVLAKERRLKIYRQRVKQYRQTSTF